MLQAHFLKKRVRRPSFAPLCFFQTFTNRFNGFLVIVGFPSLENPKCIVENVRRALVLSAFELCAHEFLSFRR